MARTLKLDIVVDDHGAIQKLAQVDAAIDGLAEPTKRATEATQQLGESQARAGRGAETAATATSVLTGTLARYLTAGAALGAIKASLDYASGLQKMADTLQLGTVALQELENVAVGSNTTLQTLTSSIFDMQRRLAGGDAGAVAALGALNIKMSEFLQLKGDEQFFLVARALAGVENQMERSRLAFELFGLRAREVLPALVGDVDALRGSVRTLTAAQIADLAKVEQAWQQLVLSVKRAIAVIVGEITRIFAPLAALSGQMGALLAMLGATPSSGLGTLADWQQPSGLPLPLPPLPPPPAPSFAGGTDGYQWFGSGTPALLHGWEKVTPLGKDGGGVTLAPGAIVINYPIASDARALQELARLVGRALMQHTAGLRMPAGA